MVSNATARSKRQVSLGRLSSGERISSISAIALFAYMFFPWFGVEAANSSSLLIYFQGERLGKSAWEALDFTPIVLVITIAVTLAVALLRFMGAARRPSIPVNAGVAILGTVSVLLILYRIVDPPVFYGEGVVTYERAVELPIFVALLAAAGIAFGGLWATREERVGVSGRRGRHRGQTGLGLRE